MKLNWRRIAFIVLLAELLFVYWNMIGVMQTRKRQAVHPAIQSPLHEPLSQLQTPGPVPQTPEAPLVLKRKAS
ncbi:hypothetical protein B5M42_009260 [Paenibacillus athensensis]|uniref:Uncharacterized protein n=1 Tax=Paenibacillus athensensis TaxID=1967502 RepID=A0A4Y8Q9Q4_9BACL|nr:hypothetical protein [Paenibacillus athensensis]MCD1259025.1 hypothetical protein [Paenibacillus athensensis]